jgi:GMP synthase (glutamine-hydrolysing)
MKRSAHLLIILTGHALPSVRDQFGNSDQHFLQQSSTDPRFNIDVKSTVYAVCEEWPQNPLPDPALFDGIMISGSASMLDEQKPWMLATLAFINDAVQKEVPLLGVCFGHQLLAAACGAKVGPNPRGRANGSRVIHVDEKSDPLFSALPKDFAAQVSHRDVILKPTPDLTILAHTDHDPHHAIRVGKCAWGVQFHPEWNIQISQAYVEARRELLDRELGEGTAQKLLSSLLPSDEASRILKRFIEICQGISHASPNPKAQTL